MEIEALNTYDKTKEWLTKHCHKTYYLEKSKHETEFIILYRLLKRHPNYKNWKRQQPNAFKITRGRGNKALQLFVRFPTEKTDGKFRIVSWTACGKGVLAKRQLPTSTNSQLTSAMRYAIRRQISTYRKSFGLRQCVLCRSLNRIEVDHYPEQFVSLKERFLIKEIEKNHQPPRSFTMHPKRGISMFNKGTKEDNYYDERWKKRWQTFHNKNANYRYLCSTCNKKTNNRGKFSVK